MVVIDTPWTRARENRSQRQEQRLGKLPGGKTGVNSGRFWRFKRDGQLQEFLIEARTTESGSYSIRRDEFKQIRREALMCTPPMLPGMQLEIRDLQLVVIELTAFQDLYKRLVELEAQVDGQKDTPEE